MLNKSLKGNIMRTHSILFKIMHWLVACFIISSFILAWSFEDLALSPQKIQLINYHKWVGFSVLVLFIPRILSSIKGYAKLPIVSIEDKAAKFVHHVLYLTMLTTPILGWLMSSAKGFSIVWFGYINIPDLIAKDKAIGKLLEEAHEISATILLIALGLHIGGAIYRQFVKKDKIISNMI